MFAASVRREHSHELAVDGSPGRDLGRGILNRWDRMTTTVGLCDARDLGATLTIDGIMGAGVVGAYEEKCKEGLSSSNLAMWTI